MNNSKPAQLSPEELAKEISVTFTKQQLILIFNIIVSNQYKLGDAKLVMPIVDTLESLVQPDVEVVNVGKN